MAENKATTGRKSPSASKKKIVKKKSNTKKSIIKDEVVNSQSLGSSSQGSTSLGSSQNDQRVVPQAVSQQPLPVNSAGAGAKMISWVALLFSAIALCAGGYAWYLTAVDSRLNAGQQENRFNAMEQRVGSFDLAQTDTHTQITQLKSQITLAEDNFSDQIRALRGDIVEQESVVREQLTRSEKIIKTQSEGFRQEFSTLSDSIVNLRANLGRSIDTWTLEEAEQLMFIANQRLQFAGESDLAKRALVLADERIKLLADPALNSIRQLIASEITALENIEMVDTTGVLNGLTELAGNIGNLSLAGDISVPEKTSQSMSESGGGSESDEVENSESKGIRSYTQPVVDATASFLSSLGDLIQVEKNGKPLQPVISSEVRQMTYDRVKLTLESAQVALIRQQDEVYKNRIGSARQWVEDNFDQSSSDTQNWLSKLDELGSVLVQSAYPDISGSLTAIRDVINKGN